MQQSGKQSHVSTKRRALWPDDEAKVPDPRDVLFPCGVPGFRYLIENGLVSLPNPKICLVQSFGPIRDWSEGYRFFAYRAIRICVSQEVADAISATGRMNGPIITIPPGTDIIPRTFTAFMIRSLPVMILGYKRPDLAFALSQRMNEKQIIHQHLKEIIERRLFIDYLTKTRVAICLPYAKEGFYLLALEAMAVGCIVVTLDCIGNRDFCRHEENCLIAEPCIESLLDMVNRALAMSASDCENMSREAQKTAAGYSLNIERKRFQAVLANIDQLYESAQ